MALGLISSPPWMLPVSNSDAAAVYTNLGNEIGGSSVGAVSGHRLLIGSPFDNHILDCTMDH